MTPFSPQLLQQQLDALRIGIANLLGLSGGAIVPGIVSSFIESQQPSQLSVSWNKDTQRITVMPGSAIVASGTAATLPSELSDLTWPDVARLYLVIQVQTSSETVVDRFWRQQVSLVATNAFIELMSEGVYDAADKNSLVLLAVLSRVDEDKLDVDTTQVYFSENRPTSTIVDLKHRAQKGSHAMNFNPHGLELNDLDIGGMTLLEQTTSRGYMIPLETDFGVPGVTTTQTFNDFMFEVLGHHAAPGNYYLMLPSIPTAYPQVLDSDGAAYDYSWKEGTPYLEFSTTRPGPLDITWTSVRDLEIVPHDTYGDIIEYRAIVDGPVVADGKTISSSGGSFDLGPFSGASLDLDLAIDGSGNAITVPQLLDSSALSDSKTMTKDPAKLASRGQLAVAFVGSANKNLLPPPIGSINIVDTNFIGQYNLLYTIVVPQSIKTLMLTQHVSGLFYFGTVSDWHGAVYRDGVAVSDRYWNHVDSTVYLDARAYRASSVFTYAAQQCESARFSTKYQQATGTRTPPSGLAAEASIEILDNDLVAGDTVRVTFESGNNPVVATVGTNWTLGTSTSDTAYNLAMLLNSNRFFQRRAHADVSGSVVSIVSLKLGTDGNAYRLEGSSSSDNKFDVKSFSGGGAYKPNKYDLAGLTFMVNQPQSDLPPNAFVRVYVTGRIDQGAKDTLYRKLVDLPIGTSSALVNSAMVDQIDENTTYDLTKKTAVTLQLAGLDQNGQQISETMLLDDVSCFEPVEHRRFRSALAYSVNVWSKLNSWMVTDSQNVGAMKLLVLSSPSSRDSGTTTLAHVSYYGKTVEVLDGRVLKPSTLNDTHTDQVSALVGGLALKTFR